MWYQFRSDSLDGECLFWLLHIMVTPLTQIDSFHAFRANYRIVTCEMECHYIETLCQSSILYEIQCHGLIFAKFDHRLIEPRSSQLISF